jgi:hypothetical protein
MVYKTGYTVTRKVKKCTCYVMEVNCYTVNMTVRIYRRGGMCVTLQVERTVRGHSVRAV